MTISSQLSEYSLLLILCRKHFEYLSLKECLVFYQSLAWRILNMHSLNLSSISGFLKTTFINKRVGNAICKDLQRGMSRQVVLFKLILILHEFVNESEDKLELIELLKVDPQRMLGLFFERMNISVTEDLDLGDWTDFTLYMDVVKDCSDFQEKEIIIKSSIYNHEKRKSYSWAELSLSDFTLPDAFLSDETVIKAPKRINLDVVDYFDRYLGQMSEVENIYRETDVSKFHIHPDDVSFV